MIHTKTFTDKWKMVKLNDVVNFLDHKRVPITAKDRIEGAYPYYGANGKQGTINNYIFDEPLVLLAEDGGNFGNPDRTIAYLVKGKCWVNNHAHVLRPKECITIDYLCRVLEKYDVSPFIKGATRAKLSKKDAARIPIPLPPLKTQQHIATILEKADQLRKDCQQMEQELNQLAQSVFIEMFGDLSCKKDIGKNIFFDEIYTINSKLIDPKLEKNQHKAHISPEHIEKFTGKILPYKTALEDKLISGKYDFTAGTVLFSKIRPNLKKVVLVNFEGLCSADIYPLTAIDKLSTPEFLQGILLSGLFDVYLNTLPTRANIPKINRKELAAFKLKLPSFTLQKKYSKVIQDINKKKQLNSKVYKYYNNLFNALSQKAFKGELTET